MTTTPLRVAQWATGNVGLYALRTIITDPKFDLVGLWVHSEEKAGRDAGDLCGLRSTGVVATRAIEDIIAARPDCVVYMPHVPDYDAICTLLSAGINISTSLFHFNHRDSIEPELRQRLEAACQAGNASLYCSGSTPGWFTEVMPLALSAMESRLKSITITDFADMASRDSAEMLFQILPFGRKPEELDPDAPVGTAMSSPPTLRMTAEALGLPIDDVQVGRDYGLATEDVEIAAGMIKAGTVGAMRMEITGLQKGRVVIRRRSTWYVTRKIDQDWDLRDSGVHYRVDGDLPLDVMMTIPVDAETYPKVSPALTANPVVNAVPLVCAASAGLLQTPDLPPLRGDFSGGGRS